jgi:hypothetical protein
MRAPATAACAALALAAACSESRAPSVAGETYWDAGKRLTSCSEDEACAVGVCRCGVCTRACGGDAPCTGDFAGAACVSMDNGINALWYLCGRYADPGEAAICLPRCDSDAACGKHHVCEDGVCAPGERVSALPDGCVPGWDSGCGLAGLRAKDRLLDRIGASREAWHALQADRGDDYWYTEENCTHSGGRNGTAVQVEDGRARIVGRYRVDECRGFVNRYEDWTEYTMDIVYDHCSGVVYRHDARVEVEFDEQGVIASCIAPEEPGCRDNCGDGFLIGRWGFGSAPEALLGDHVEPAQVVDAGAP